MKSGIKKIKNKTVIDLKDEYKQLNYYRIGHSASESETFMPGFVADGDGKNDLVYSDIAGLFDTSGILIELVNVFINRKVFCNARKVKFIFALTLP